jgi:Double zinc ribbon
MRCPKCQHENPETVQFCLRCHNTLRYICPACKHVQDHGVKCDSCGVDFMKYAMMLQFEMKKQSDQERERLKTRSSIIKQIILLPITGGFSLLKFFRSRLRGE